MGPVVLREAVLFAECITVKPLNKDTFGTSRFVLCREVVLFQR